MMKQLSFWTGLAGVLLFVITTLLGGFLLPNYSHTSQFISESYAIDTPFGIYLRVIGYIPSGICLTIFSFTSIKHFEKSTLTTLGFWGVGIFYGVATIIVSIFPCDSGCNKELINPSLSQLIHNTTGALTYIFVPISLLLIGISLLKYSRSLSMLSFVIVVLCIGFISLLSSDPLSDYADVYQRLAEGSILLWVLILSWSIKTDKEVR